MSMIFTWTKNIHVPGIMSWSQTTCGLYVQLETHKGNHYSGL